VNPVTALLVKVSHSESLDSVRLVGDPRADGTYTSFVSLVIERSFPDASQDQTVLTAEQYPVLAAIWDNEEDAVYDDM
jgi:hypothetical protein